MIQKVLKNVGSLSTLRILSRVTQFLIKTYLIRTQLDQEILAHLLHLDFILSSSLHIAKSCFKPSYQKVQNQGNAIKSAMNIMTFGIVATIFSATFVSAVQYYQFALSGKSLLNFTNSIAIYAISAVLQAVAEKYMVQLVIKYEYFKIGIAEVICVIPKTIFILIAVYLDLLAYYGILIFAVSQFLYSLTMMLIFYAKSENKSLFLQPISKVYQIVFIDEKSKQSLKSFSIMSVLKFLLQQFQQLVLVVMDVSHVSSMYSLINNLGSIIVRYLFAPFNEIAYNHFSRGSEQESIKGLLSFLKYTFTISILVVSFGYNYAQTLLQLLYSAKWVNDDSIKAMRTYMVLVVFLGLNGVIQTFMFARGKQSLNKYNYLSLVTTTIYLCCTIVFLNLGLGAAGLFLGNIINMALRICVCWHLQISSHISFLKLLFEIKPSALFIATSVILFIISHKQYGFVLTIFQRSIFRCIAGGILVVINLFPILFQNRQMIVEQYRRKFQTRKSE